MIVCDNCMLFKSSGCIGEKCYTLKKIKKEYDDKMKAEMAEKMIDVLGEIYDCVYDADIPSPTVPEYVEHHEACLKIMSLIKQKINQLKEHNNE